jgi:hypothetical protein
MFPFFQSIKAINSTSFWYVDLLLFEKCNDNKLLTYAFQGSLSSIAIILDTIDRAALSEA